MPSTINASTSSGLVQTADTSGVIQLQSNGTTRLTVGSSGVTIPTLNNDTGVLATQNGMTGIAKAWVNFNGTGTPAIRGSFNVSSITDNGTGNYTVNYTTAMPSANYAIIASSTSSGVSEKWTPFCTSSSASSGTVLIVDPGVSFYDSTTICVAVFSS